MPEFDPIQAEKDILQAFKNHSPETIFRADPTTDPNTIWSQTYSNPNKYKQLMSLTHQLMRKGYLLESSDAPGVPIGITPDGVRYLDSLDSPPKVKSSNILSKIKANFPFITAAIRLAKSLVD